MFLNLFWLLINESLKKRRLYGIWNSCVADITAVIKILILNNSDKSYFWLLFQLRQITIHGHFVRFWDGGCKNYHHLTFYGFYSSTRQGFKRFVKFYVFTTDTCKHKLLECLRIFKLTTLSICARKVLKEENNF